MVAVHRFWSALFSDRTDNSSDLLHSKLITIFRGVCALEVFLGHMRNQFFPDYKDVVAPSLPFKILVMTTGYGYQSVMLFFVISGWLVGGSFLNRWRQPNALANYAVDRVSRLWTVFIPSMIYTF